MDFETRVKHGQRIVERANALGLLGAFIHLNRGDDGPRLESRLVTGCWKVESPGVAFIFRTSPTDRSLFEAEELVTKAIEIETSGSEKLFGHTVSADGGETYDDLAIVFDYGLFTALGLPFSIVYPVPDGPKPRQRIEFEFRRERSLTEDRKGQGRARPN